MADPTQTPDSISNSTSKTPGSQETPLVGTPVVGEVNKQSKKGPKKTKKLEPESKYEDSPSSSSEDESSGSSSNESTDESTYPPETVSSGTADSGSEKETQQRTKSKTKRSKRRNQKKMKKARAHRSTDSTTESYRSDNGSDSSNDNPQPVPQPGVLLGTQGAESTDIILALAKRLTAMEAELNEARRNVRCNHTINQKEAPEEEPKKSKKGKIKIGTKVEFKRVDQCVLTFCNFSASYNVN